MLLNENIIKALIDNTPHFIDNVNPQLNDQNFRDSLLYKQLYPYMPVTTTFKEEKSYITVSLGIVDSSSASITNGWIRIYVICHMGLVQTESGQRHGFIANEIDNMMFSTSGFGIGKISDKRIEEIIIGTDYIGVFLQYHITDFAK
jgi:hypothetical protein